MANKQQNHWSVSRVYPFTLYNVTSGDLWRHGWEIQQDERGKGQVEGGGGGVLGVRTPPATALHAGVK